MVQKKMGRPTEDPKINRLMIRLSNEDELKLSECVRMTSKSKAEIIREGIDKVYSELKK